MIGSSSDDSVPNFSQRNTTMLVIITIAHALYSIALTLYPSLYRPLASSPHKKLWPCSTVRDEETLQSYKTRSG